MFFCTNSNIWIVDAAPPHPHSCILSVYRMALLHHGCWVVKPFIHSKNRICETCNILPPSSDIPSHPVRPHFPFQAIHQRVSSEWVAHVWRNTTIWYENVAIIIYHHFASHRVASHRSISLTAHLSSDPNTSDTSQTHPVVASSQSIHRMPGYGYVVANTNTACRCQMYIYTLMLKCISSIC